MFPKPETTVIFSAIRSIAKIFGLMLSAPLVEIAPPSLKLNKTKSIIVAFLLMFIQWQLIQNTPKMYKLIIFYSYTFVVYTVFQYLFLSIIPKFCAQEKIIEKPKEN